MTTTTADQLVADYLQRLHRAAGALPHDQARELVDEIGGHIASARADSARGDEAQVRTVLDRLGTPEEIVASAREDAGPDAATGSRPPGTGLELAAVLMLTAGSFLPVVGWLVGVVLLWSSRRWTVAEKLLGTLVVPLGPGGVMLLAALPTRSCSSGTMVGPDGTRTVMEETCTGFALPVWLGTPLLVVLLVAPVVVAVWLYRRASARAVTEPPLPARGAGGSGWGGLEIAALLLLALGSFVAPFVAPLVGLVLACCSSRWSSGDKGVAAVAPLLSLGLVSAYYLQAGALGFGLGIAEVFLLSALLPFAAATYLALRLPRR